MNYGELWQVVLWVSEVVGNSAFKGYQQYF